MISLSSAILKKLLAKLEQTTEESCGFILGKPVLEEDRIGLFFPVENNSDGDKSKRYKISSKDYLFTEKSAIEMGLSILGVYHTHINHPAIPSELDRKFAFPGFHYLIISLVDFSFSELKCWKINNQRKFVEESIQFN